MIEKIREYSIPLIVGVVSALIWANISPDTYQYVFFENFTGTDINVHWLIENVFMVFFFAIAMVEIVKSLSKGGALNPISKAVNPILATLGGVMAPVGVYFILNAVMGCSDYSTGWGICTATDIAISWLAARIIFGKNHPATSFLLLLAVADDAIGLGIIAIFYPEDTPKPIFLLLCIGAMAIAYIMNKKGVQSLLPYVLICGTISWIGMFLSNISPALSLVLIVPFFPNKYVPRSFKQRLIEGQKDDTPLVRFGDKVGPAVDFGLIFFGIANAGVEFSSMSALTAIVCLATMIGKTLGIYGMSELGRRLGFSRPRGMGRKATFVAGITGGMGLTVALFVANVAFQDQMLVGASKMGALFTVSAFIFAFACAKSFKIRKIK